MNPWWILIAGLSLPLVAALYHVLRYRAKAAQRPVRDPTRTPTSLMTRPGWHQALARQQGQETPAGQQQQQQQPVPGGAHDDTPGDFPN